MTREHTMERRMAGLFLTMLFSVATAATAATDADLTREVEKRLADKEVVGFNVAVQTKAAEVTLRGEVPSLWHREWAMEEAWKTDDVVSVVHLWGSAYERGFAHGSVHIVVTVDLSLLKRKGEPLTLRRLQFAGGVHACKECHVAVSDTWR